MALGMVRNPDRVYETLEQLPESLDHKLLRLRTRGLALARINPKTLQWLLQRLGDFITSKKPEEAYYFTAVVRAFAQTRGETLDAVALSIAAYLDSDDNPSVRRSAAYALGNIGSEHAVDALLKSLLKDQDSSVRQRAALALGSAGSERACDTLLKALLEDQDNSVQVSALYALGSFGPERMNDVLSKAWLEDQDNSVLFRVANVLASTDSEHAAYVRKTLLEDQKSSVRGRAVGALRKALLKDQKSSVQGNEANSEGSMGLEQVVDPLLKALIEDQGAYAAWHPADVLGNIAAEKFAAGLMLALSSKEKSVRRKAAEVVGYYVNEACLAELERLAATDESDEVKEAARAAVEKVKHKLRYFDKEP
jgi:HEAT repeat protein